ncbi:MAG: hypothetical protein M3R53_09600, partial [Candidatus Eremiobacteraeota bacterium]|nr:hypothetical protein [Candidatus Eremiobacteraeota bacterium]
MGPRAGLSTVLIAGAVVLVIAIAIGNGMGNRVLGKIKGHAPSYTTTPLPTATPTGGEDAARQVLWKRRQVLSVATDPAFPDPRITPEPPPEATARPRRSIVAAPKASPSPTPSPTPSAPPRDSTYTSPPLLIPMKSHAHDESPSPE